MKPKHKVKRRLRSALANTELLTRDRILVYSCLSIGAAFYLFGGPIANLIKNETSIEQRTEGTSYYV